MKKKKNSKKDEHVCCDEEEGLCEPCSEEEMLENLKE